jgi:hypothetical protein
MLVYTTYMDQLKNLFTNFYHSNCNATKRVTSWRELEEKNQGVIQMILNVQRLFAELF